MPRKHWFAAVLAIAVALPALVSPLTTRAQTGIYYGGGPVMSGPTNIYVIYYGGWGPLAHQIIDSWLATIGGTSYFGVTSRYRDYTGASVQNAVNYNSATNSYTDNYSLGRQLTDSSIQTIISNALSQSHLPLDSANGIYFVLTASDVTVKTSFGTTCYGIFGYHNWSTSIYGSGAFRYAVVHNPVNCAAVYDGNLRNGDTTTPNGSIAGDGTVNEIFHELAESVTDPYFSGDPAWGILETAQEPDEIADMCEWVYGNWNSLPVAGNGAHYNATIGGTNYLIQRLFRIRAVTPASGEYVSGTCNMANEPVVTVTSSESPARLGQSVTYTATVTASDGGSPTGTISFTKSNQSGTLTIGTAPVINGQATIQWTYGATGTKFITATYSGDWNYEGTVSSALPQQVNAAN